ncbi:MULTISPECIES: response regulator transcription factor [Bacillaceae]|jgi:DNA-binding response OmpR family regulator|uniref:Response regulator n=1 Tax=Cytobacillus firmus TaxID=1399 RepID=A0AA46PIJ6_CYTFI|nr:MULTISPECIES: response regulator [Bacillaceae]KML44520.1 histidine kinase [Cytobacillus firmus]MCC3646676.1 response regulator [Cytobacillus oceanisediminis]MCU1806235.1 response regulator [Cytobacillus firmus]UYG95488.1 response regulator [Cytobacillus firmus]WHY32163.1 response regulator [Cytobacillus firmus]
MKKILIAEDEEILRMLIADTLEEGDFEVDEAEDGEEALKLLEKKQFDLVILDYMMPGLTGLDVIRKIRGEQALNKEVKILMLSAKSQQNEQEEVLKAGADYFMVKPFSPLQLFEKVGKIADEA